MSKVTAKIAAATVERLADQVRDTRASGAASPEQRAVAKVATFRALWPAAAWLGLAVLILLAELWVFRASVSSAGVVFIGVLMIGPGLCVLPALYFVTKVDHEGLRAMLDIIKRGRGIAKGDE